MLDADGVLVLKGAALPGAVEAVRTLQERHIPFRVVTNFSQLHRATLAGWLADAGLTIEPDAIITASSATAAYAAANHAGRPLFVLAADDARREFDGQRLVAADEADAMPPGRSARSSSATPATTCRTATSMSRSAWSVAAPSCWRCIATRGG